MSLLHVSTKTGHAGDDRRAVLTMVHSERVHSVAAPLLVPTQVVLVSKALLTLGTLMGERVVVLFCFSGHVSGGLLFY